MKYNFIEIGTSDFRTLIETATNLTKGISVEPIKLYLDKLPNKDNVIKANYAISNEKRTGVVYYIKPEDIIKYKLPNWVRGCNSIDKPHPSVVTLLGDKHDKIVIKEEINIIAWVDFIKLYDIESINLLKIDTEGHDGIILSDYYDYCKKQPELLANKIIFENNILANTQLNNEMINKFKKIGYTGKQINFDYELIKINVNKNI